MADVVYESVTKGLVVADVVYESVTEALVVADTMGEAEGGEGQFLTLREATYRILAPYEGCNE